MDRFFTTQLIQRKRTAQEIKDVLLEERNIVSALIFGSFAHNASFRDIDLGVL